MDNARAVSQTAMLIASLRALACYEDDLLIRGNDTLARLFLPEEKRRTLENPEARRMLRPMIPTGLFEYVIARTKHFDHLFGQCLQDGFRQIVLLGAGYDSRPYRLTAGAGKAFVFEADAPATQQEKRRIMADSGVPIPDTVRFVAVDFECDDLFGQLTTQGYDATVPTLFIWEGVTYYLSPQAVDEMLRTIGTHAAPGSLLGFDFQHIVGEHVLIDTKLQGEQSKFGMNANSCADYLGSFGFRVRQMLDAQSMENRYLLASDGTSFGHLNPMMYLVTAEVTGDVA